MSDELAEAIAGGQPLVLTWRGRPAAVVLDVESYLEGEQALIEAYPWLTRRRHDPQDAPLLS